MTPFQPAGAQPGTAPASPPEGAAGAEPQEQATQGGFTVCIRVDESGGLSVGVQGASAGAADIEDGGAEGYVPAADRKEALTLALEILKGNGEMPAAEDDSAFNEGFTKRNGSQI
jgi:hypothetical protein